MIDSTLFKRAHPQSCSAELDDAQNRLRNLFEKQKQHVIKVVLLPNFSIDHDRSQAEESPIYRGLVVNVKDTYELSPEDKCWFHPELGKGRSAFMDQRISKSLTEQQLGSTEQVSSSISPFNSSAGEYYSQSEDAYGIVTKSNYSIVSSCNESVSYPLWSSWFNSYTSMKKVYASWKRNGTLDNIQKHRDSLVGSPEKPLYQDVVNNIMSDGKSIYVTNHAVKCNSGDRVLCEISPTAGFVWFKVNGSSRENDFVPSDCGFSDQFVNIHALREEHKDRFYKDCSWLSKKPFNTYVMRKPLLTANQLATASDLTKCERAFMKKVTCSSQPVLNDYDKDTLLKLPPLNQNIQVPFKQSNEIVKYVLDNYHQLNKEHPSFDLINPKYLKQGALELPREIVESCL